MPQPKPGKTKKEMPSTCSEVTEILKKRNHQKQRQQQSQGINYSLYHPVVIILTDETIEIVAYCSCFFHMTKLTCKDTKNNSFIVNPIKFRTFAQ